MNPLLLIALGGASGSLTRFHLGKWINDHYMRYFPIGTFLINVTGAFLMGIVMTCVHSTAWLAFLADGFLGAYTTFSTFQYEGFSLWADGEHRLAIRYYLSSLALGLIGFALGVWIGTLFS